MTITLDDLRNKRFRMGRKAGYEIWEVDAFIDEVEERYAQLLEDNRNLKTQIEALKSAPPIPVPVTQAPTAQPPVPQQPAPAQPSASDTIVVTAGKEASAAVVRLVELTTEQAERLVEEATADANRIREEANRSAHQLTTDAGTRAARVESEARVNAERLNADARTRAEKLDREIESRRAETFDDLEKQRADLTAAVGALHSFEAAYRTNLTGHLRKEIESLESVRAQPDEAPDLISWPEAGRA
jgi:DivIVA domain-containing protein